MTGGFLVITVLRMEVVRRSFLKEPICAVLREREIAAISTLVFDSGRSRCPRDLSKSAQLRLPKNVEISGDYKFRTKTAKYRALEKSARRERISGLSARLAVQRFADSYRCLLKFFARWRAGREWLVRCNWRRDRNRNPTFSRWTHATQRNCAQCSVWIHIGGLRARQDSGLWRSGRVGRPGIDGA